MKKRGRVTDVDSLEADGEGKLINLRVERTRTRQRARLDTRENSSPQRKEKKKKMQPFGAQRWKSQDS